MRFYIGTYTRMGGPGVVICQWDQNGSRIMGAVRNIEDPTYAILSRSGRVLYAVGASPDTGEGAAAGYAVQGDALIPLGVAPTGGKSACHLALSPDERHLFIANYATGSLAVLPAEEGRLRPRTQLIRHGGGGPDPVRQAGPHIHQCVFRPGTQELFVTDLGADRIALYQWEDGPGRLRPWGEIPVPPGMGPRHLIFSGPDRFYLLGELDSTIRYYHRNREGWRLLQTESSLPGDFHGKNLPAAVRIHQGTLYASNRGHDSLCAFTIGAGGYMTPAGFRKAGGRGPRDFDFGPMGLITANEEGGVVLEGCGAPLSIPGAVCVCIPGTASLL